MNEHVLLSHLTSKCTFRPRDPVRLKRVCVALRCIGPTFLRFAHRSCCGKNARSHTSRGDLTPRAPGNQRRRVLNDRVGVSVTMAPAAAAISTGRGRGSWSGAGQGNLLTCPVSALHRAAWSADCLLDRTGLQPLGGWRSAGGGIVFIQLPVAPHWLGPRWGPIATEPPEGNVSNGLVHTSSLNQSLSADVNSLLQPHIHRGVCSR